ncbi:MAG: ferredoxin [Thermodesulfobacteriota bacterium]
MALSITIDVYECNGCGSCVEICPEVFVMDETDEKATLVDSDAEVTEKVEEAAAYCPQKCIDFY